MLFSELSPYVRYARYMNLDEQSHFNEVIALDARLFYTVDGYGKIKVEDTEYEMFPHSLIIINSGISYHILPPEKHISFVAINFDFTQSANTHSIPIAPVLKNEFTNEWLIDHHTFKDVTALSRVLYIKQIPTVRKEMVNIIDEYTHRLIHYESKIGHMLALCIAESIRVFQTGVVSAENDVEVRILSYMHENLQRNVTNKAIGELFNYHPNYVSSLIKRLTGMPIHQYMIHIRLLKAANLLENTALSCGEIAAVCGFYDSAFFSKSFKSHFGISPSKYRNA